MPQGTTWKLFTENDEAWNSILADCAAAKVSIDLEQFIFFTDEFGRRLIDVCRARAKEGVKVRFLWDAVGSFTFLGSNIADELKRDGIELVFWKTLIPSFFKVQDFRSWFFRNHRRTLVVDKKVAYTGSICIDDNLKNWRDTNLRLIGPVVAEMQNAFDRMWLRAQNSKRLPPRLFLRDPEFRYITNQPRPGRRHIYTSLIEAIRTAEDYIYITTPYFVPTHRLIRVMKLAASRRGVDVRLLVPMSSNRLALDLGAQSYFETLLESGVRIFRYEGNMIHSKTAAIDGIWATVGTMNLDRVSLLYNYEANIVSSNKDFAQEVADHFLKDLEKSAEVTYTEWHNRSFIEHIPSVLIKLVRKFL